MEAWQCCCRVLPGLTGAGPVAALAAGDRGTGVAGGGPRLAGVGFSWAWGQKTEPDQAFTDLGLQDDGGSFLISG